jgi:hypothetical protein
MKPAREDAWREISPYLDAVLDLAPEARQPWLDDLDTRRPDIARRLRDYLIELAELDDKKFLSVPAASLFTRARLASRRFGAHTLERALGYGGMGSPWLANWTRALLTASRVSLADGNGEAAERFARDALAISEGGAHGSDTSADVGEGLLRLAQVRLAAGASGEARAMLERAIQCLSNGLAATHPLTREAQGLLDRTLHS